MKNSTNEWQATFSVGSFPFHQVEILNIPTKLVGIYAIFNETIINNKREAKFIKLGFGNLHTELEKLLLDPSVKRYNPTHFSFIKSPDNPEKKLNRLIVKLHPFCL